MNGHPEPPPEGALIEAARREAKLSVREASRRAGISEGWWRQVVKGYQTLSGGGYGLVRDVPAATIARMARAAGVEPDELAAKGQRPDAAQALRDMPAEADIAWPIAPSPGGPFTREALAAAAPYARVMFRRLDELQAGGIERPAGFEMFPDNPRDADAWDEVLAAGYSPDVAVEFAATIRGQAEQFRREQHRRSGTRGA